MTMSVYLSPVRAGRGAWTVDCPFADVYPRALF